MNYMIIRVWYGRILQCMSKVKNKNVIEHGPGCIIPEKKNSLVRVVEGVHGAPTLIRHGVEYGHRCLPSNHNSHFVTPRR